ncbi:hypothetical protein BDR26DRAFT_665655 [Obelidium mucronatum]|nr:hypothetical protein BDR26DRAFT_665655 [Obelidium mucronatum]
MIRVNANCLLLILNPSLESHREFGLSILDALLARHESGQLKAKFDNTIEHRCQIRLWCSIHLLLHHIVDNETTWTTRFIKAMDMELIQSTRHYVEWALMRIFLQFPSTVDLIWSWFDQFDLRSTTTCSLLSVLVRTLPLLPTVNQSKQYNQLFSKIIPWLTSNHFTIRLYAQYVAYTAWQQCNQPHLKHLWSLHAALESMVDFIHKNGDCVKHRQQAENLYFVRGGGGGFHPLLDLSVDFLFRGGLGLANVTEEERISAVEFLCKPCFPPYMLLKNFFFLGSLLSKGP